MQICLLACLTGVLKMAGVEIENVDIEHNIIIARQEDIIALPYQEDEGYFSAQEKEEGCDPRVNNQSPDSDNDIESKLAIAANMQGFVKGAFKPLGVCFRCKECGKVAAKTMRIKHLITCLKRKKAEKNKQAVPLSSQTVCKEGLA